MKFAPPIRFTTLWGPVFLLACTSPTILPSAYSTSDGSAGDASILRLDLAGTVFNLDVRVNPPRGGSDAPPGPDCGDNVLNKNEACDDGNTTSGDGCAANCLSVESGWSCPKPGKPCRQIARCGDGLGVFPEQCDDGNKTDGDGCSSGCKIEIGYKCDGSPSVCTHTTCGDGKVEGAEGCDDGNAMPFDGCSSECQNEPMCKSSGACTSRCGDGIVLGDEECDDGNNTEDDGCSSSCKIEAGFKCTQAPLGNKMMVPVVYRDFKFHSPTDFEGGVTGSSTASTGIVKSDLDADGKPAFTGLTGGAIHIASQDTFSEWYRNTDGVNHATPAQMTLWNNGKGAYTNRFGANGQQWLNTEPAYYCGNVGTEMTDANGQAIPCTSKYGATDCDKEKAAGKELLKCTNNNGQYSATFIVSKVDGNPLFFPVDSDNFTPASERNYAQVPPYYDPAGTWPKDVDANGNVVPHNFSFTSEVRYWFKYTAGNAYVLDFVGDDDVWVFINKKLAVDLGGIHTPVAGSVTLDPATAAKLGISDGHVYEAAVFQAERQTTGSSYKLTLNGFNASPSACTAVCGDGILSIGEECDEGALNGSGGYGTCGKNCTLGAFCGDGIVQPQEGEDCDDGGANGLPGHCPSGCRIIPIP